MSGRDQRNGSTRARFVGAMVAGIALIAGCSRSMPTEPKVAQSDAAPETATVTRQDLETRDELDGTLGYQPIAPLIAGRAGTVTWMPDAGTIVRRGDVVAEIDGAATHLLLGRRPVWRRLAVGCPDGPDIRQLNDNLAALGYADRDDLPGAAFDWRTSQAVYRWQADTGSPRTGVLELGDVMFLPHRVRIGTVRVDRGARIGPGATLADTTRRRRTVTVNVDAARLQGLRKSTPVVVALPNRTTVDASVRSIGRVVSAPAEPDAAATAKVRIDLTNNAAPRLQAAPVTVIVDRVLARDVLTVPVAALLAVADGGYVVERVTDAGTERVGVEPGQFADGRVEVTGDLDDGDRVVVPS